MTSVRRPIIAIDGPAGSGKSTVAKILAQRLHYQYIDTGAMYRAVTVKVMRQGVPLENQEAVEAVARAARIEFEPGRIGHIRLDHEDVSAAIRTPEISRLVSAYVASYPGVRQAMVSLQRELGRRGAVVMEGRDITTVVFPDAEIKIYLHASQEVRAQRRFEELKDKGLEQPYTELLADLQQRDQEDRTRPNGALQCAPEAVVVDSTVLNVEQVVAAILQAVQARENQPA